MDRTEEAVAHILAREGWPTFTDHPDDRGGPTKGGITLATYRRFTNDPEATVDDLKAMPEIMCVDIYTLAYIADFDGILDDELFFQVVDAGVLHGTGWAKRRLQEIVGVAVDGVIGPLTLAAVNEGSQTEMSNAFLRRRVMKLVRIAQRDPTQLRWLGGWIRRALEFL